MKILHVLADTQAHGPAGQLALVHQGNADKYLEERVVVLGDNGPGISYLRAAGLPVEVLEKRLVPLTRWWRLRRLIRTYRPQVIHAWDSSSLRAVTLAGGKTVARLVATPSWPEPRRWGNLFDRWLLRGTHRLVAASRAAMTGLLARGFSDEQLALVPPGIAQAQPGQAAPAAPPALAAPEVRWVVAAGSLHYHQGFQYALWAFDLLGFIYDNLHLLIVGAGPDRNLVAHAAGCLRAAGKVQLLPERYDADAWLAHAEVVWALTPPGGIHGALAGMAAARPVVAFDHSPLLEIIVPGATGYLVSKDEPVTLAKHTRELLDDPQRARRMGEAGRHRADHLFSARQLAQRLAQLYTEVAA